MPNLPYRQIHLDFHTSEAIDGIGADFDPDVFADTLVKAHVASINIFGMGHHGWLYYPSKAFPEQVHPHLETDLLPRQIEALHKRGIKAPVYITVQTNEYLAQRHPEWRVVEPDGRLKGPAPYEAGFWHTLCLNTPFIDRLKAVVAEVMETLPADGIWLDIVHPTDCSCRHCREDMLAQGLEPSNPADRMAFGRQVFETFLHDMDAFVHERNPDALLFFNSGHIGPHHRPVLDAFTHLELESLPSGGWGYLHFPMTARYARTLDKDFLGMTGKFHTSWGDFHSFKNEAALEFECFHMLALNAKVCVGDQLHPRGVLDPYTYDLVGGVYAQVEEKEPWCVGAEPVTEIAVLTPEGFSAALNRAGVDFRPMMGVTRMLQEAKQQFDVVDGQSDFSGYKVLVLPDQVPVEGPLADKLQAFLDAGGAIIASYASGMDAAQTGFTFDAIGATLVGEGPRDAQGELARGRVYRRHDYSEYVVPRDALLAGLLAGLRPTEHVMYIRGMLVKADPDAEVLADVVASYFDRTYKHFCSHHQAPSSGRVSHAAAVQKGNVIYFSHPIFTQYQTKAPRWCKQLFLNALARLLPDPVVRVDAPTATIATLNRQPAEDRLVLHLLHYVPERRGEAFDVIEDVLPLYDVPVSVKVDGDVSSVTLVPQGEPLAFDVDAGRVTFIVPKVTGHQMVAIA